MKKKVFSALTVVFALCLALTAYALNNEPNVSAETVKTKANCCAKKDSCPMKDKQNAAEKAACCDKADCCCKGGACPMKSNGEKTEGKECCGKGNDSCPMKKDAEKQSVSVDRDKMTASSHTVN